MATVRNQRFSKLEFMNTNPKLDDSVMTAAYEAAYKSAVDSPNRAHLLPALFQLKGKPYSIKDYPQFAPMYSRSVSPDTIYMSARQLGKSMNLSRSEVLDCMTSPHIQVLYVAPLQKQTQRYSQLYLRDAITSCEHARFLQTKSKSEGENSSIVQSVMHQTFSNGAGIQLTYAKTSPDRARGIMADRIDFDEIQDQLIDNIPIISESLSSSTLGLKRYTGTAKTTDNTIERLWQDSSMCEWVMKCPACNYWNIPNSEGRILDMIRAPGVCCIKCGHLLDVRKGEYVPAHPERTPYFQGYHIPQIIVPAITENPLKWTRLIRKVLALPLATVLQEILGISCSLGARVITQEDITRQSTLPTMERLQKRLGDYVMTVGGVDWGVAEQTSFTVHTIIGLRPDGTVHTLWAKRFAGFNPDEVMVEIAKAHRYYGCQMLFADFGMGYVQNVLLANRFGLPVVQIMYVRQNKLLSYNPYMNNPRWTVDKVTAMELLFLSIKYGRVFFPPQEEFKKFTDDLLSPYEQVTEVGGLTIRSFNRNPNHPDDFCHALCFALMGLFKISGNSIVDVVPGHAMGANDVMSGAPTPDHLNPDDLMASVRG